MQGLTAPMEACMACLLSHLSRSVQRLTAHFAHCGDTNTRMHWTDAHTSAAADTCHLLDKVFIAVQSDMFLNCHPANVYSSDDLNVHLIHF